jgi:hypothetical protein
MPSPNVIAEGKIRTALSWLSPSHPRSSKRWDENQTHKEREEDTKCE